MEVAGIGAMVGYETSVEILRVPLVVSEGYVEVPHWAYMPNILVMVFIHVATPESIGVRHIFLQYYISEHTLQIKIFFIFVARLPPVAFRCVIFVRKFVKHALCHPGETAFQSDINLIVKWVDCSCIGRFYSHRYIAAVSVCVLILSQEPLAIFLLHGISVNLHKEATIGLIDIRIRLFAVYLMYVHTSGAYVNLVAELVCAHILAIEYEVYKITVGRIGEFHPSRHLEANHVAYQCLVAIIVDHGPFLGLAFRPKHLCALAEFDAERLLGEAPAEISASAYLGIILLHVDVSVAVHDSHP